MNPLPHLPLAAVDAVQIVIGVITVILWIAGHLLNDKGKAKPQARPRPQVPPGPAAGAPAAGKPASLEESLRREVEEFMRRAQGREPAAPAKRPGAPAQPPRPPQRKAPTMPAAQQRPAKTPPRRLADSRQTTPVEIEAGRGALTGATIGEHVAEHLGGVQTIATHAQTLGANVAQADERMEAHLQERFTHRLGALAHQEAPATVAVSSTATDLLKLLSQPGGAKTMIVANEILRRPEERWRSSTRSLRRGT